MDKEATPNQPVEMGFETAQKTQTLHLHYVSVKAAIEFLNAQKRRQPSLKELSHAVHMSEFDLQRVFSQWAGISTKKFLQFLTKEYALGALKKLSSLESRSHPLGLSSPSRPHDLRVTCTGLSPGEVKTGGAGIRIEYGWGNTPFGRAIVAWTQRGICHLMFCDSHESALLDLKKEWPAAEFVVNHAQSEELLGIIFKAAPSNHATPSNHAPCIRVLLKGTPFQMKVWEALMKLPFSSLSTYAQVAQSIDAPKAQRATGSAIAKNSIAYLIPCHRVIRGSGELSNYRWGVERKMAMIAWEASLRDAPLG
jgi:AraC family transcriptional regulator of adaptative response/methylated-DNA-[protein]-cysteine methyltransferase